MNSGSIIFFAILFSLPEVLSLPAQENSIPADSWKENGIPYIRNYTAKEYGADFQNWCIAQDPRGVIYAGNNLGLLEFDGSGWRLTSTLENGTALRSLAIDSQGRIYGGTESDFGYFEAEPGAPLRFHSLRGTLDEQYKDFNSTVWYTLSVNDTIYFMAENALMRWAGGQLKVWKPAIRCHTVFAVGSAIYVWQQDLGLTRLQNDSLRLVQGGEFFAHKGVYLMQPYGASQTLIGTFGDAFFLYDGEQVTRFPTTADAFVRENKLYCAAALRDGYLALGTLRGGLGIMDGGGNLVQVVNTASGLQDDCIFTVCRDQQDGIWLGLNRGIARIETPAPLSSFAKAEGLEGLVEKVGRHDGKLYAATNLGLYIMEIDGKDASGEPARPHFQPAFELGEHTFAMISTGEQLLVGTTGGIRQITGDRIERIPPFVRTVFGFFQSRLDSNSVFVTSREGVALLKRQNGSWQHKTWLLREGINQYDILEDARGILWTATNPSGVLRIELPPDRVDSDSSVLPNVRVTHFDSTDTDALGFVRVGLVDGHVLVSGSDRIWRFDDSAGIFEVDSSYEDLISGEPGWGYFCSQDHLGRVWVSARVSGSEIVAVGSRELEGHYTWDTTPFTRMQEISQVRHIYPETDGTVWIASDRLFRYVPGIPKDYSKDFPVLIRRVAVSGDSVIYRSDLSSEAPNLAYDFNNVHFDFSAATFDAAEATVFESRLDGFDRSWSNWSTQTTREYTNLPEGEYRFEVRAKNIYGQTGRKGAYPFVIRPPWFRTNLAYLFYILAAIGIIAVIVKSRIRHLEKKTVALEALVAERTGTIREQAEKLQELDRIKSRFFTNISHEFRTPLTLILGPLESVIARVKDSGLREELSMMARNANRLLRLINQLLDLSRIEAGGMQLHAAGGDFLAFLKGLVMSFASLAEQRNIDLRFQDQTEAHEIELYFDRDKIEKIFYNLLGNAFKFTPAGGRVTVVVAVEKARDALGTSVVDSNSVVISVADTGAGIPADRLPHIFDRFYQVDDTHTREHEGTGIGLALTRELTERHHGSIDVRSEDGIGTEFVVRLPLGKEHFAEDELSAAAGEPGSVDMSVTDHAQVDAAIPLRPLGELSETGDREIVLVVDDHPDVRSYISKHLQPDYQVLAARNGAEGLDSALEAIPDLIISDVMMPGLDGYQLCEALKTNDKTSHIPVVLLTAKAGEESKLAGLDTGADDYLTKPFSSKELLARVRNLIESRQKLRERFRREGLLHPREVVVPSVEEAFLRKLMQLMEEHLANEDLEIEILRSEFNMAEKQFYRKIKSLTGQTPTDFIRTTRLRRAKQLLEQHAGTVSEVAFQVGFNNLSYFARCFREEFGQLPSEIVRQ